MKKLMVYYSRYRPCRLSLQKECSLIRHAPAVGQARIAFIVAYSPFTLNTFSPYIYSKILSILQTVVYVNLIKIQQYKKPPKTKALRG